MATITKILIVLLGMALNGCTNTSSLFQTCFINKNTAVIADVKASDIQSDLTGKASVPTLAEPKEDGSSGAYIPLATLMLTLLTILISYFVYVVKQQDQQSIAFRSCSKSLYSDNQIEQASAAILLRCFLKKRKIGLLFRANYTREATSLLVALLKTPVSPTLQKNLADGFSFVENLDGQDMQNVNMQGALIKPRSRVLYELTRKDKYKNDRILMRKADFFHAVVQECSINNVDAEGAIFLYSILCGTSFKNCILKNARFDDANISRVLFDEDCVLEGASFKNAVGIKDAKVKRLKDGTVAPHHLQEFLDTDGVFHEIVENHYQLPPQNMKVFVSKLGVMNPLQKLRYDMVINQIGKDFELNSIERKDYLSSSQLTDVVTHLEKCDGCVIFAFKYLDVESGNIHKDVEGKDNQIIKDKAFASPWLHIETALANGKQMPCLIVCDENLCRDGMFDEAIVNPDKNMFVFLYSDNIESLTPILTEWKGKVAEFHRERNKT